MASFRDVYNQLLARVNVLRLDKLKRLMGKEDPKTQLKEGNQKMDEKPKADFLQEPQDNIPVKEGA